MQQKTDGVFDSAFGIINKLIVWGADAFRNHPDSIQYVLKLCEVCLNAKPKGKNTEAKNAEAALIYQLLLQILPAEMRQYLGHVLTSVMLRYNMPIANDFIRIKLLNTVMCSLSIDPQATMTFLVGQQVTEDLSLLGFVLDEVCRLRETFLHSYDKKVAVFGLCRTIQQESLPSEVVARLKSLFEAIIAILSATAAKPMQLQKNELDVMLDGIMSDEEATTEFSQDATTTSSGPTQPDERELNTIMSQFMNPEYERFDEYDCLRQMLSHLQTVNPEALNMLVSPLPPARQKQLAEIVQKRRMKTADSSARRIVKAVHRIRKP